MTDCAQAFTAALARFRDEHFPPRRLLVGLSGGLDSVVLLRLCHLNFPGRTRALHVNHRISAEADDWQRFCRELCQRQQIPFLTARLAERDGERSEAAARDARYRIFVEHLEADELLLLAHHADDAAETILLHVLQGRGAFGMPESRPLGSGWLLRPLLEVGRRTLEQYARREGLEWIDDPGNLDPRHDRNFLRHQILPALQQRFAPLPRRLRQTAAYTRALESSLIELLELDVPSLPVAIVQQRSATTGLAILRAWLSRRGLPQPSARALRDFLQRLDAQPDHHAVVALPRGRLQRYRERIYFVPDMAVEYESRRVTGPEHIELAQGSLVVSRGAGGIAAPRGLQIRFWSAADDRQHLPRQLFSNGRSRPVSELLRQAGIPPWRREGYPLICDDQGVVELPGIARRDDAVVTSDGLVFDWQPTPA